MGFARVEHRYRFQQKDLSLERNQSAHRMSWWWYTLSIRIDQKLTYGNDIISVFFDFYESVNPVLIEPTREC
jgi:hypothetical protein